MRLALFCEARADSEVARDLIDRVLRDNGGRWVADALDGTPEAVRIYLTDDNRAFFGVHRLTSYVQRHALRVPHGHFDGKPGAADAVMGRTIFAVVRAMQKADSEPIDATVIVRDLDNDPSRATGLAQARTEATSWASFRVVLGCANIMREAWVLAGFECENDDERHRLGELRADLGFSPVEQAHRLDSNDEHAKRSPKRALRHLSGGDWDREARCWQLTPLTALRGRGTESGLAAFLAEVVETLVPLCR